MIQSVISPKGVEKLSPLPLFLSILVCSASLMLPATSSGQVEQSDEMRQLLRLRDEEEFSGSKDPGGQFKKIQKDATTDIGTQEILRKKPEHRYYEIKGQVDERITDNAALSPFVEESDLINTTTARFNLFPLRPESGDPMPLMFSARAQFFRYRDFPSFDFNRLTVEIKTSEKGSFQDLPFYYNVNYAYEEFRSASSEGGTDKGDLIRSFHVLQGSVFHVYSLSRYQALIPKIAAEVESTINLQGQEGTRDDNEKNNFTGSLTYYFDYSQKLNFFAVARYQESKFKYINTLEGSRRDENRALSAGAEWSFNPFSQVTLSLSDSTNNSNSRLFEYEASRVGVDLQFSRKF